MPGLARVLAAITARVGFAAVDIASDFIILPGIWWACLLAFFCLLSSYPAGPANPVWYVSIPICGTGVLAVIITALLVQKVSNGPLGESA